MRGYLLLCLLAASALPVAAHASPPAATLDGRWTGTFADGAHGTAPAAAALTQTGSTVTGSLTLAGGDASGTITVAGDVHRMRARLAGTIDGRTIRWKARWGAKSHAWRGRLVVRVGRRRMRGMLGVWRGSGSPAECGATYFASDVMPTVLEPVCAQCHVAGGLAQNARLRVVAGDPVATALGAIELVDASDPAHSLLLLKPRADVAHGGGRRIDPGSAEEQVLQHWIELVTAPSCGSGGGGGGGGGGPTGDPWVDNCAVCHGADARGVNGYPDVHCSRSVTAVVRAGRTGGALEMPAFPTLPDQDIATIEAFLAALCPAGTATGADLFTGNCASCHGLDATGSPTAPAVRCATRAGDAIRAGRGTPMPALPALGDPDVALIELYLGQLCDQHGRAGADLYVGNCAGCHGADARGGRSGLGVAGPDIRCNRAIQQPVRTGNHDMPAFPGLSDADIGRVQQYLATTFCAVGTATGAELFASNCATCHGADARGVNGQPNIRCNRSVHDPVRNGRTGLIGTMPAFPTMSDGEISLVQGYLTGLCPAGTATGSDLYAGNCLTCHGTDAGGTADAPNVRCATRVPDALAVGRGAAMPSFPGLAGADLTSLTTYLAGVCVQYGRTASDLYAGNCPTCHGSDAGGGRNARGVRGPDIQCTSAGDYREKIQFGDDAMPRFPALSTSDADAIAAFVRGAFCPGG